MAYLEQPALVLSVALPQLAVDRLWTEAAELLQAERAERQQVAEVAAERVNTAVREQHSSSSWVAEATARRIETTDRANNISYNMVNSSRLVALPARKTIEPEV